MTKVSVFTTTHPWRSKRIPIGSIVNAHMGNVNSNRPARGVVQLGEPRRTCVEADGLQGNGGRELVVGPFRLTPPM